MFSSPFKSERGRILCFLFSCTSLWPIGCCAHVWQPEMSLLLRRTFGKRGIMGKAQRVPPKKAFTFAQVLTVDNHLNALVVKPRSLNIFEEFLYLDTAHKREDPVWRQDAISFGQWTIFHLRCCCNFTWHEPCPINNSTFFMSCGACAQWLLNEKTCNTA